MTKASHSYKKKMTYDLNLHWGHVRVSQTYRVIKCFCLSIGEDPPEVLFHHQGYLFLATEETAQHLQDCVKMQR